MSNIFSETDLTRLEKNIEIRESMVAELTKEGLPSDPKDVKSLLDVVDSIDRSIISRVKITSDDKNANIAADAASLVAKILLKTNTGALNRHTIDTPILDDSVIVEDLVEGETEIGVSSETYDQFIERMSKLDD